MERTEPWHAFHGTADQFTDALFHFARRLVGEGDGQDFARVGPAGGEDVGDACGQHTGLTGASACEHENGTVQGFDGGALFGIEIC